MRKLKKTSINKKFNFNKKIILSALLFLCLAFLVVSVYVVKNRLYHLAYLRNPFNFDVSHDRLDVCRQDSDCMLADYKGCCGNKKPINKKYLGQYNKSPLWQKDLDNCNDVVCPWFVDGGDLKCKVADDGAKRCTTQIDVAAKTNIDACLAKYDFITKGDTCGTDCEKNKGVYAIYVGDGGQFEEIMSKTNYQEKEYKGIFPKDIENKVIAVYDVRNCEPCEKKFFIRENIGLNPVDVYRFCYYLQEQNSICKDCGKVVKIK